MRRWRTVDPIENPIDIKCPPWHLTRDWSEDDVRRWAMESQRVGRFGYRTEEEMFEDFETVQYAWPIDEIGRNI